MKPPLPFCLPLCILILLASALSACERDATSRGIESSQPLAVPEAGVPDQEEEAYDSDPPARAPRLVVRTDPQDQVAWTLPAPGAVSYDGLGSAAFGASTQELRGAWDGDLSRLGPDEAGGCHYLFPEPRTPESGYGMGFMVEGDRFTRIDVDMPGIAAPEGGEVGMSVEQIRSMYGERAGEQPHKYLKGGVYLRVPADSGEGVLVFEADADGRIQEWRLGVPPQVDYVEGCS